MCLCVSTREKKRLIFVDPALYLHIVAGILWYRLVPSVVHTETSWSSKALCENRFGVGFPSLIKALAEG